MKKGIFLVLSFTAIYSFALDAKKISSRGWTGMMDPFDSKFYKIEKKMISRSTPEVVRLGEEKAELLGSIKQLNQKIEDAKINLSTLKSRDNSPSIVDRASARDRKILKTQNLETKHEARQLRRQLERDVRELEKDIRQAERERTLPYYYATSSDIKTLNNQGFSCKADEKMLISMSIFDKKYKLTTARCVKVKNDYALLMSEVSVSSFGDTQFKPYEITTYVYDNNDQLTKIISKELDYPGLSYQMEKGNGSYYYYESKIDPENATGIKEGLINFKSNKTIQLKRTNEPEAAQ